MNLFTRRAAAIASFIVILGLVTQFSSTAKGSDKVWIGGVNGDFFTQANWNPSTTIADTNDFSIYNGAATTGYGWQLSGPGGSITVNGASAPASATFGGTLFVGRYSGRGDLFVLNGGHFDAPETILGDAASAVGVAQIAGVGAAMTTSTLRVGNDGRGSLSVDSGGGVSVDDLIAGVRNSAARGEITVRGDGSSVSAAEGFWIGSAGAAVLTVTDGGRVFHEGQGLDHQAILGHETSGVGTAAIMGSGSEWTTLNELWIGNRGAGNLDVFGGGRVTSRNVYIAKETSSVGEVAIDGAGSLLDAGNSLISIGNRGTGALIVRNGGALDSQMAFVGYSAGSTGAATVDGEGSSWATDSVFVGFGGAGSLQITRGGAVDSPLARIGSGAGASGAAIVDGPGSSWTVDGIAVGDSGAGSLTIGHGGTLSSGAVWIGALSGSSGAAIVDGLGSLWTASGDLKIGDAAAGRLETLSGGRVFTSGRIYIADDSGATGAVVVEGAGSALDSGASPLYVGNAGNGTLDIAAGGVVADAEGIIGRWSTSTSSRATVAGTGSAWINHGDFYVGYDGVGSLTISDGALVSATGDARLAWGASGNGAVNLQGGTLSARALVKGPGAAAFNWTGGELDITGASGLTLASGGLLGSTINLGPGKTLHVANTTAVNSGVTLAVDGGELITDGLAVSGTALLRSGAIHIDKYFTVSPSGSLEITGQDMMLPGFSTLDGKLTLDDSRLSTPNAVRINSNGVLSVQNGGALTSPRGIVGDASGSSAAAIVNGANSTWAINGDLFVGGNGAGTLQVTQGATITNARTYLGNATTGTGAVTVSGVGTTWINAVDLSVGVEGAGTLDILSGGAVHTPTAIVGVASTSTAASVTVAGAGSTWINDGDLSLGDHGAGTLTVDDGGVVSVAGELRLGSAATGSGTVNLKNGTLSASAISKGAGAAAFNWSGGALEVTGPLGLTLDFGGLFGPAIDVSEEKSLHVTGATLLNSGVTLAVAGGRFSAEHLYVKGIAQLRSGTAHVGKNIVVSDGGILELVGQDMMLAEGLFVSDGQVVVNDSAISMPTTFSIGGFGYHGSLDLDSGIVTAAAVVNEGVMRMGATGPAVIRAPLLFNYPNATILGQGSLQAAVSNSGTIALSGNSSFTGDVTNSFGSKIIVTGNTTATFFEDFDNGGGYFYVEDGARAIIFGGFTAGAGNQGPGDVYSYGDLRPGASPGLASFGGDLSLGPLAGLEIELGGLVRGDQYDAVDVAERLTLNGALNVTLDGGYSPQCGDSFEILTAGELLGRFTTESFPAIPGKPGLQWLIDYDAADDAVSLSVASVFAADFEEDLDVDADDLARWEAGFGAGTLHSQGDADADRDVDGRDFLVWQRQYGIDAPLAANVSVPEPASAALIALCIGAVALRQFVRRGPRGLNASGFRSVGPSDLRRGRQRACPPGVVSPLRSGGRAPGGRPCRAQLLPTTIPRCA